MNIDDIKSVITSAVETTFVVVESADNVHFYATVVAEEFETMTKMQQHKRIMTLFQTYIADETIHALSLKTYTPAKWAMLEAESQ